MEHNLMPKIVLIQYMCRANVPCVSSTSSIRRVDKDKMRSISNHKQAYAFRMSWVNMSKSTVWRATGRKHKIGVFRCYFNPDTTNLSQHATNRMPSSFCA